MPVLVPGGARAASWCAPPWDHGRGSPPRTSGVPASECACVAAGREAEGVWRAGASLHAEHPDQDATIQPCQSWREQARQVGRHAAECTALRAWRPPHPPPTRVPNRALQQAGQPCGPSTKGCLALQGMGAARGRRQRSLGQPTPGDGGGAPLPAALSLTTCGCLLRSLNFQPNTNPRCGRSGRCQSHHWQQKIAAVAEYPRSWGGDSAGENATSSKPHHSWKSTGL
jgi:hypothetical protein